ncbi:hypothetical protein APY03_7085 [Variovorax sp. WDL1]|nr:hypothetical protein APY03_7085 [Variovorax sp. WDL1]
MAAIARHHDMGGMHPDRHLSDHLSVVVSMAHTAPAPAIAACSDFAIPSGGIFSAALAGSPLLVIQTRVPSGATCTLCAP